MDWAAVRRTVELLLSAMWPPFCAVVDWTAAAIIAAGIVAGVRFHH
jgi:hypothetical protein